MFYNKKHLIPIMLPYYRNQVLFYAIELNLLYGIQPCVLFKISLFYIVFESFTSCYVLLNKNMIVLDFNEAMSNFISDIDKGDLQIDSVFSDFLSPAYRENFYKNFGEALNGNRIQEELSLQYVKFGEIWWKITFAPMLGKEKQVIGVSVNCVNINERKNHELKILKQNQSLLKIAHMQSHEFRKPVASIKGIMQLIKADNYLPDVESLIQMERAVQELDEKILKVIMLSKTFE